MQKPKRMPLLAKRVLSVHSSLLVLVLSLVGCDENADIIAEAKRVAFSQLKDPESARFDDLQVVTNAEGELSVCGSVNAKNAMGGYVGFAPFSYSRAKVGVVEPDDTNNLYVMLGASLKLNTLAEEMYSKELRQYHLAGCAGPETEKIARSVIELIDQCERSSQRKYDCLDSTWKDRRREILTPVLQNIEGLDPEFAQEIKQKINN